MRVDAKHPVPHRDAGARSAICRANLTARRRVDDVRYPDHWSWRWRQHDRLQRRQRTVASAAAVRRPGTPGLGRERTVGEPVEAGRSSRTSRRSAAAEPVAGWPRRVFAVLWRRRHQADRHRRSGARHRCAGDGGLLSAAGRTSLAGTRLHRRGMPLGRTTNSDLELRVLAAPLAREGRCDRRADYPRWRTGDDCRRAATVVRLRRHVFTRPPRRSVPAISAEFRDESKG